MVCTLATILANNYYTDTLNLLIASIRWSGCAIVVFGAYTEPLIIYSVKVWIWRLNHLSSSPKWLVDQRISLGAQIL